ncbi:hypothetical protein ACTXT7_016751 [Hymenolepis weldensis]
METSCEEGEYPLTVFSMFFADPFLPFQLPCGMGVCCATGAVVNPRARQIRNHMIYANRRNFGDVNVQRHWLNLFNIINGREQVSYKDPQSCVTNFDACQEGEKEGGYKRERREIYLLSTYFHQTARDNEWWGKYGSQFICVSASADGLSKRKTGTHVIGKQNVHEDIHKVVKIVSRHVNGESEQWETERGGGE